MLLTVGSSTAAAGGAATLQMAGEGDALTAEVTWLDAGTVRMQTAGQAGYTLSSSAGSMKHCSPERRANC